MRRRITALVALLMLAGLAVPAAGIAAEKTTYRFFECYGVPDLSNATIWFSGANDTIMHLRGGTNHNVIYVWDGSAWSEAGTNDVGVNLNTDMETGRANQWGTNVMDAGAIGEFAGTWTWGNVGWVAGHASARGIGDDAGKIAHTWLLGAMTPDGWTAYPVASCTSPTGYGYFAMEVIDQGS